jgi:undecaprenyl pyrophosphate phosphatase UppP
MSFISRIIASFILTIILFPVRSSNAVEEIENPLKGNDNLLEFFDKVLDIVIKLGAIIALVALIVSGFMFVTAGGNEEKITTAKRNILYVVIGAVIILGAKVILEGLKGTLEALE